MFIKFIRTFISQLIYQINVQIIFYLSQRDKHIAPFVSTVKPFLLIRKPNIQIYKQSRKSG